MNTLGYLERLKRNDQSSEVWWDSSPAVYLPYKKHLLEKYPAAVTYIEALMPDEFSQPWGLCSATTNPRLVTAVILDKREYWSSRFNLGKLSPSELRKQLYNEVIVEGAATLKPRWIQSAQAEGWISAQVDPVDVRCTERMTTRGLELQRLAPNVMVKVPGSLEGMATVEQLVAQGAQQLTAANGVGQVIVAAVFGVEQHQRAAVVQGVQFALVQRGGLVEAVAVAFQQFGQARTGQATQLVLGTQLHGEHSAVLRLAAACRRGLGGDCGAVR